MKPAHKLYRFLYTIVRGIVGIFYPLKITGRENIPEGTIMACANHSSWLDAFFIAFAFGWENHMHIIAKIELLRIPILSYFLRKIEIIGVDRAVSDISAIRETLKYMKAGEKIAIFPEGTRVLADDAVAAKRGAVWLAERGGAPLLPVYIPTKKRLFRRNHIVIGMPYSIPESSGKRTAEEYLELADDLMERIRSLGNRKTLSGAAGSRAL